MVNKSSPATPVINGDASKDVNCSVINNFIHSCISKITYKINDFQMGDSSSKSYSYRAYLDNLLSFSREAKQQNLKYHGYIQDKAKAYDNVSKTRFKKTPYNYFKVALTYLLPEVQEPEKAS